MVIHILRLLLTSLLIYMIYTETGIFTAIGFGVMFIHSELVAWLIRSNREDK